MKHVDMTLLYKHNTENRLLSLQSNETFKHHGKVFKYLVVLTQISEYKTPLHVYQTMLPVVVDMMFRYA